MRMSSTQLVWEMIYFHPFLASPELSSKEEHNLLVHPSWTVLPAWIATRVCSSHTPLNICYMPCLFSRGVTSCSLEYHLTSTHLSMHATVARDLHVHACTTTTGLYTPAPACTASPAELLEAERASSPASSLVQPSSSESPSAEKYNKHTFQNSLHII